MASERFVVIRVPRDVVEGARVPEGEFEKVALLELAVALYARGVLSLGQARRLAGLSSGTSWRSLRVGRGEALYPGGARGRLRPC